MVYKSPIYKCSKLCLGLISKEKFVRFSIEYAQKLRFYHVEISDFHGDESKIHLHPVNRVGQGFENIEKEDRTSEDMCE